MIGMPSSNKSQDSSSRVSCPCTGTKTVTSAVVAKELVVLNYILIVTPSIVAGIIPFAGMYNVYHI